MRVDQSLFEPARGKYDHIDAKRGFVVIGKTEKICDKNKGSVTEVVRVTPGHCASHEAFRRGWWSVVTGAPFDYEYSYDRTLMALYEHGRAAAIVRTPGVVHIYVDGKVRNGLNLCVYDYFIDVFNRKCAVL